MRKTPWFFSLGVLVFVGSLAATGACRGRQSDAQAQAPNRPAYMPTATIKDLMDSVIDPSADVVWLAVTSVETAKGTAETAPHTDEDWKMVRRGAISLTEAANLLVVPGRHMARPGEKSETPGVELEPEEMEALIAKDPAAWHKRARALHEAGVAALQAIDARDAQRLFEVGEQIERACENCHTQYWYPNEKVPPVPESPRQ